ncbi:unnamed protein product [Cyprideis torosa]|uniref:Uncharacterized protein n=1 Tax=Cyprideis torosa TaxID=163714 RepID=A0A7R8W2A2_9CRUS|nr:unnamed protein product [Cyprideis torosa]CAG0881750.1 unnamed protein product [Cyprideis torosa]
MTVVPAPCMTSSCVNLLTYFNEGDSTDHLVADHGCENGLVDHVKVVRRYAHGRSSPWWNRRTSLEKLLIIATTLVLIGAVVLAVALIGLIYSHQDYLTKEDGGYALPHRRLVRSAVLERTPVGRNLDKTKWGTTIVRLLARIGTRFQTDDSDVEARSGSIDDGTAILIKEKESELNSGLKDLPEVMVTNTVSTNEEKAQDQFGNEGMLSNTEERNSDAPQKDTSDDPKDTSEDPKEKTPSQKDTPEDPKEKTFGTPSFPKTANSLSPTRELDSEKIRPTCTFVDKPESYLFVRNYNEKSIPEWWRSSHKGSDLPPPYPLPPWGTGKPESDWTSGTSDESDQPDSDDTDDEQTMTTGDSEASEILQNMNTSVDPCDDFFEFACGSFVANTVIPDDRTSVSQFSKISDKLKEDLRLLVQEEIKEKEPAPFIMLKQVYKSCMDKGTIAKLGEEVLHDVLRKMGGWPILEGDDWDEKNKDLKWTDLVFISRDLGFSVDNFLDFSVVTDIKNSSWRIIDLDQPSLGMGRKYFMKGFDDPDVQAYYRYMVDTAVHLGADPEVAERELKESLLFEIDLSNFTLPDEERRNVTLLYNRMTIGDLSERWPSVKWLEYINNLLAPFHKVTTDEPVIVDVPSFIDRFLEKIDATPKRVIANYGLWRVVSVSISYLTEELRDIQLDFSTKLTGQTERQPRWKECMGVVLGSFANAVGSMYVRRFFKEESKKAALDMVHDIRDEFNRILDEIDWMDEVTRNQNNGGLSHPQPICISRRQRAKNKSKRIATHIAYPDELLDDSKLTELYDNLQTTEDQYYRNMLNMTVFGTNYSFKRLREAVNKSDWISHGRAAVVNAFYSSIENSIQFPAGILQGVFFSSDRPRYLNYGAIGFVIGHEITHGFDDQGRQFDPDGNLVDWWEPETDEEFRRQARCIINQYGNFTVEDIGMNVNGKLTVGENIADNGGLKQAYRAYVRWEARSSGTPEPRLPGLPYNARQMFWISAANVWCQKVRQESLKMQVLSDNHAPAPFRINGPFSNLKEFSHDFHCPAGSPLNPAHKCTVNGINTQGENIADNGGLKQAYRAYVKWVKDNNDDEPLLHGVKYCDKEHKKLCTQHQLFWLSAANIWCSVSRPQAMKIRILTGQHSPPQFRVNGPMRNLNEFANDFNCPVGSPMNPPKEEQCSVW